MKYEPKTTEWMRQNNWGAEAQQLVTDDLTSCEACLAEAEREIKRLSNRYEDLVKHANAVGINCNQESCGWCHTGH